MEPPLKQRRFSHPKQRAQDVQDRLAISIGEIDIGVSVHHRLAVTESLADKDSRQPVVFRIVSETNSDTYAWWPLLTSSVAIRVLDALYVTLVFGVHADDRKREHRTLVDSMLILMAEYKESPLSREEATTILTQYFGTSKLGKMRKVHFHGQSESGCGEIDFYHLPLKVTTYTWVGL